MVPNHYVITTLKAHLASFATTLLLRFTVAQLTKKEDMKNSHHLACLWKSREDGQIILHVCLSISP